MLREIYGNSQPFYRIKITYLYPQTTLFLQILSLFFILKNLILPDISAKRKIFNNFDAFTSRMSTRLRRYGKILSWVLGWSTDQPWPHGWLILPTFRVNRDVSGMCDPLALHCESFLRPQWISKWPNIVFKQTISYGNSINLFPTPNCSSS